MELKKRKEIIRALECCGRSGITTTAVKCKQCPYSKKCNFGRALLIDALALIKEFTEEIKDLEADYDRVYEQAEADIHGNIANGGTSCHWCADKTKVDTVRKMQKLFEERLDITVCGYSTDEVVSDVLDTLDYVAEDILKENV